MNPPIMNILASIALATMAANAASPYIGSLSIGAGLHGEEEWDTGSSISWIVSNAEDGCAGWNYSYTLTVIDKDISHAIIEVSDIFEEANILGGDVTDSSGGSYELSDFGPLNPSNPGMPEEMKGIKVEVKEGFDTKELTWSFCSDIAPVWGDFYAKDGKNDTTHGDVYLFNTGFTDPDPTTPVDPDDILYVPVTDHIIVPDSVGGAGGAGIPEPGTAMLGALGILLILRRRIN